MVIPRDAGDHGYLALEVDGVRSFRCVGCVGSFRCVGGFRSFRSVRSFRRDGRFGRGFASFGGDRGRVGGGARGDGELLGLFGGRAVLRLVFGLPLVFGLRWSSAGGSWSWDGWSWDGGWLSLAEEGSAEGGSAEGGGGASGGGEATLGTKAAAGAGHSGGAAGGGGVVTDTGGPTGAGGAAGQRRPMREQRRYGASPGWPEHPGATPTRSGRVPGPPERAMAGQPEGGA